MAKRIAIVADLVLMLSAITIVTIAVHRFVYVPLPNDGPPEYHVGETFGRPDVIDYRLSERTLVIFINSTCRFCTDSMPFYRRLGLAFDHPQTVRVVAASFEDVETSRKYLASYDVNVDHVTKIERGEAPKLLATPTVLVLDKMGIVRGSWLGLLTEERELEVNTLLE